MAKTDDIDVKSAVRKFLERRVVVDREDETADSSSEVQAILESVALSFLLFPQASLSFVLLAKNILQQVVSSDIKLVEYMSAAVADVQNPSSSVSDTSDLIEAQTALVEVDRLGRVGSEVKAYDRYNLAVSRFLDRQLSKSLKRRRRKEFERSGSEAKQDLFRALSAFSPTHAIMITRMGLLSDSMDDYDSVDLTRTVATKTVTRVRASLRKLVSALQRGTVSKTVSAVELLAGAAALQSISNTKDPFDPTIRTGEFPVGRDITISSEPVAAVALGDVGGADISVLTPPWVFNLTVDPLTGSGTPYAVTLPYSGAGGRAYVTANRGTNPATFNIPASNRTLYIQLTGLTPPANQPVLVYTVTLTTGAAVPLATIISEINAVLGADATCVEMAPGSNRLLIYGSSSVTGIVIRSTMPGTFDGGGNYLPVAGSANAAVGFKDDQASSEIGVFSAAELTDILSAWVPLASFSVVDEAPRVASNATVPLSSLSFGGVASSFGFDPAYASYPSYLVLEEDGEEVVPADVGIFVGSEVTVLDAEASSDRSFSAEKIVRIDGTSLFFDSLVNLPRCEGADTAINSPAVAAVQRILEGLQTFLGEFDDDERDLQRVLSPLLSSPTLAQINDATRVLDDIHDRLTGLYDMLAAEFFTDAQTEFGSVAKQIIATLEERGMDRALDLLKQGSFSLFFALDGVTSSKSGRLLSAIEQVGRNDFPVSNREDDTPDTEPLGTTPDDNITTGQELADEELL